VQIDGAPILESLGPLITAISVNIREEHKPEALSASAGSTHTLSLTGRTLYGSSCLK